MVSPNSLDISEAPGADLAAVLVHPHPGLGGDRFNHVIDALYRGLPREGVTALRFDLTSPDPGRAGQETLSAISAAPSTTVVPVGYSFGADIGLGIHEDRVAGWVAIAPPLRFGHFDSAGADPRPKLLLVPEHDQFTPPDVVREATGSWAATEIVIIEGADHFLLEGASRPARRSEAAGPVLLEAVLAWLTDRSLLQARPPGSTMGG